MRTFRCLLVGLGLATAALVAEAPAVELQPLLKTLLEVGPKGAGNAQASQAWGQLARADAAQLPAMLAALDDAEPLAANWIRAAVDAVAERQVRAGGKLPQAELERFLLDTNHAPRARRLAYEWVARVDPTAPDRLIPGMIDDPSVELRRDAVARLIDEAADLAEAAKAADPTKVDGMKAEVVAAYLHAFESARDIDQIKSLVQQLKDLGQEVDLARHFGFLLRWKLIGPFDNTDEKGYDVVYSPEREIDLESSYPGKQGTVKWFDHVTGDDYGTVDFNKVIAEEKGVVAYAAAEFVSAGRQEVEIRVASANAVKLWLNGTLIDEHNVYHAGGQMDGYTPTAVLRPGRNVILVKVCQNEQTQNWAGRWNLQLRVCDSTGGAILSSDRD